MIEILYCRIWCGKTKCYNNEPLFDLEVCPHKNKTRDKSTREGEVRRVYCKDCCTIINEACRGEHEDETSTRNTEEEISQNIAEDENRMPEESRQRKPMHDSSENDVGEWALTAEEILHVAQLFSGQAGIMSGELGPTQTVMMMIMQRILSDCGDVYRLYMRPCKGVAYSDKSKACCSAQQPDNLQQSGEYQGLQEMIAEDPDHDEP